jgi:uncharacterized protein
MDLPEAVALIAAGFAIGAYAAAIGTGGGFLVAPLLLIRHPGAEPVEVTSASLTVVAVTSVAASLLASAEGRVDRPVVLAMAAVAIPAALLGGLGTTYVPRTVFAVGFALLLLAIAAYTLWRPVAGIAAPARRRAWRRQLVDREGNVYVYRIPLLASLAPNAGGAFLAALAGIGGGPIGIPIMTRIMRVPHAVAIPSMHLLFSIQATAVVLLHLLSGNVGDAMLDVPWLAAGVVLAAPLARRLRRSLGEGILMRMLAVALVFIALRTAWAAF